jgi:hypothetical protein
MSDTQWLPDEAGITYGGEIDDQVGDSSQVRYLREDQPDAMITCTVYPVNAGGDDDGPFIVRVEYEWLVCGDPVDPGGTELWQDSREDETGSYGTAAEAVAAARDVAQELLRDAGSHTWDGLPHWDGGGS